MRKNALKRVAAGILVGTMVLCMGLTGCSKKTKETTPKDPGKEMTALEVTKQMGNGINLGNTMEAYGHKTLGVDCDTEKYETYWGQPVTTKEMVQAMKDNGFDTIRIPVAWTNMMDYENGDYTINEKYLNRVAEIVDYAMEADMYAVVNDHWDGSWWGMFGSATQETRDKAMELYKAMWTQIAEKFKDYDSHLIFESANEELGNRLNDKDVAADSGTLSKDECYETTNLINQTFVDLVRKSGGNNDYRFLLIAGYDTNIDATCDDRYKMPEDTAKDKLIVSVHYYDPWNYCGGQAQSSWGVKAEYEYMNDQLKKMTKFTDAGYGVIIGEYGALMTSDGEMKNDTIKYFTNFLDNCDLNNFCPILWDCNNLFVRNEGRMYNNEVGEFFLSRNYDKESQKTDDDLKKEVENRMAKNLADAPEKREVETPDVDPDSAIAWIMFNGGGVMYSVGDKYNPSDSSDGVVATDVPITGAGTYTVSLDFSNTSVKTINGMTFSALAIANGEILYPGYFIEIKEILLDDKPYELTAKPYTTADDAICTRVNLINEWVGEIPEEARTRDGDVSDVSAVIVDKNTFTLFSKISITFDYVAPQ